MDVRGAIEQFIAAPGDQFYGDDREPLQKTSDHARANGNAEARAMDDATDLFRGVPVELGTLAQFVRTNFHSDSPREREEQNTLIAALSTALEQGSSTPREVGPDHGKFNPRMRIDTSEATVTPAPPRQGDPRVTAALDALVERSPGYQSGGGLTDLEDSHGPNPDGIDRVATILQTYAMYTVVPAPMEPARARAFMRLWVTNGFVLEGKPDPRLDPQAVDALVDELLAYAKRSVDRPQS